MPISGLKRIHNLARFLKYLPLRLKYKLLGYKFGGNFAFGKGVIIEKDGSMIGYNVYIGPYSYIGPKTILGNFCMLSDNVNIIGTDHNFNQPGLPIILAGRPNAQPITILEDDVWIGHGVTIMRGVTIGEGSIVGANSVVTKDIPPYSIYVGNPAKFVHFRFSESDIKIHQDFLAKARINISRNQKIQFEE